MNKKRQDLANDTLVPTMIVGRGTSNTSLQRGAKSALSFQTNLMRDTNLKPNRKTQGLWRRFGKLLIDKKGQDLIEYALVVALIAFAAAAGMTSVATKINEAFTNIGTKVGNYTS